MPSRRSPGTRAFDISVLGDKQLQARMTRLPIKVQRKHLRKEARVAFKETHKEIKRKVPAELKLFRRKLKLRVAKKKRRGTIKYRIFGPSRDELGIHRTARPGSRGGSGTGYYPAHWELGYTTQTGRRMPERDFMRGGLKASRPRVLRKLRVGLWRAIRREAAA